MCFLALSNAPEKTENVPLTNGVPIFRKCRTTFDTTETRREFGPVVIDYAKVQSKVTLKYDAWHKDTLGKFGALLGTEMTQFHSQVSKSRSELEEQSIEAASTSDAVSFITYVQSLKRKMKAWEKQVLLRLTLLSLLSRGIKDCSLFLVFADSNSSGFLFVGVARISAKKHKRQKAQAPIRNRKTRKVANAKLHNRYTNLSILSL